MRTDIKKKEFLILCLALENGNINMKEFKKLSNIKFEDAELILKILSMNDICNRDELYEKLINIKDSSKLHRIKNIFEQYPIFKTDIKRQTYLLKHLDMIGIVALAIIIQENNIWTSKELLEKIEGCFSNRDDDMVIFAKSLIEQSKKYPNLYEKPETIEGLKKILSVGQSNIATKLLPYLEIEMIQNNLEWLDYLKKYYQNIKYYSSCEEELKNLEEYGYIEQIDEQFKNLSTLNIEEEEKIDKFHEFINNIISLEKDILTQDRLYTNILLNHVGTETSDNFYYLKELLTYAKNYQKQPEEVFKLYSYIKEIEAENVQGLAVEAIIDYGITDISLFKSLSSKDYLDAKKILLEFCEGIGNIEYVKKHSSYIGEYFSEDFITYINEVALTKEELLEIKNKVITAKTYKKDNSYIIDTKTITSNFETVKKEKTKTLTADDVIRKLFRGEYGSQL